MTKRGSARQHLLSLLVSIILLQFAVQAVGAVADRSLYVTVDKPLYTLGETVKIKVDINKEGCKEHDHILDIYVYDSQNLLIFQIRCERPDGFGILPTDFPVTVACTPPKTDGYTVKLYVMHMFPGGGHRQSYLEDTITFRVTPYVATSQTTMLTTTASLVTITRTVVTTTTTSATVSITTEEREMVKVDWVAVLMLLTAVAVAFSIFAAFEIGKRRGKESRELHRLPFPPKGRQIVRAYKA